MLHLVDRPQPLRLVYEGALLLPGGQFPLGPQPLGCGLVVHLWIVVGYLAPQPARPQDKGVHGPHDAVDVRSLHCKKNICKYTENSGQLCNQLKPVVCKILKKLSATVILQNTIVLLQLYISTASLYNSITFYF